MGSCVPTASDPSLLTLRPACVVGVNTLVLAWDVVTIIPKTPNGLSWFSLKPQSFVSLTPYLSCLFSCAARSSSWMFLVICSVFRITSSVLGKLELGAASVSSGMDPSPCQMMLLCRPFLPDLQRTTHRSALVSRQCGVVPIAPHHCGISSAPWHLPNLLQLQGGGGVVVVTLRHAALLLQLGGLQ